MASTDRLDWLLCASDADREALIASLDLPQKRKLARHWSYWARPEQLPPPGNWRIWLACAGRGFGKTRAGAEWVNQIARSDRTARIALVGSSIGEARSVMVEGESGILACASPCARPRFEPSLKRLTWPNGAQAHLYSAAEPEGLRGPQHSHGCGPGAEGGLSQRSACPDRHAAAYCSIGNAGRAPCKSGGWRVLAGCARCNWRLEQPRWRLGLHAVRQLVVRQPARWHGNFRRSCGPTAALSRWLAIGRSRGRCRRRQHD